MNKRSARRAAIHAKHLLPVILSVLFAFLITASWLPAPTEAQGINWSFTMDFEEGDYCFNTILGQYQPGGLRFTPLRRFNIIDENSGKLQANMQLPFNVYPSEVILYFQPVGFELPPAILMSYNINAFGIESEFIGTRSPGAMSFILHPTEAGTFASNINISAQIDYDYTEYDVGTMRLAMIQVFGAGANPFDALPPGFFEDTCAVAVTQTPSNTPVPPTNTFTPAPTDTFTPAPTYTPSPTDTLTPSVTPTCTSGSPYDFWWSYPDPLPDLSTIAGEVIITEGTFRSTGTNDNPRGIFDNGPTPPFGAGLSEVDLTWVLPEQVLMSSLNFVVSGNKNGSGDFNTNTEYELYVNGVLADNGNPRRAGIDNFTFTYTPGSPLYVSSIRFYITQNAGSVSSVTFERMRVNSTCIQANRTYTPTPSLTPTLTLTRTPNPSASATLPPLTFPPLGTIPSSPTPTRTRIPIILTSTGTPVASYTPLPTYTLYPTQTFVPPSPTPEMSPTPTLANLGMGPAVAVPWGQAIPTAENAGDLASTGNGIIVFGRNLFGQSGRYLETLTGQITTIFTAWEVAVPVAIDGLPHCASDRLASELCAIWYIVAYTVLAGQVGLLIIPAALLVLDLWVVFAFIKQVRAILERIAKIFDQ